MEQNRCTQTVIQTVGLHHLLEKIYAALSQTIKPKPLQSLSFEKVAYDRLSDVDLYIQDESSNPTGTHKYYLGISALKLYAEIIENRILRRNYSVLPQLTTYSSGNAAYAISWALKLCGLPQLKTVLAPGVAGRIEENLRSAGCEVFRTLNTGWVNDLLTFSNNSRGIDFDHYNKKNTLSTYENLIAHIMQGPKGISPDAVCMPYGSGQLFKEALAYLDKNPPSRPVLLIGVTADSRNTYADKLCGDATHQIKKDVEYMDVLMKKGILSEQSKIAKISEQDTRAGEIMQQRLGIKSEPSASAAMAFLVSDSFPKNYFNKIGNGIDKPTMVIVNTGYGKSFSRSS